jgi:uncharacterized protein YdcH (DUF465 family)
MSDHLDLVLSRLANMLKRIGAQDADFDDLCARHAEITAQIRKLNADVDPSEADRQGELRRRRAAMEEEMFAIMQANTRV